MASNSMGQKVGTAGTTGVGQTQIWWTKWDFDEQIIGHNMKRATIFCPTVANIKLIGDFDLYQEI